MSVVPNLPHGCGSWIGTSPEGRIGEFYLRHNAEIAAALGWKIETVHDYLCRVNHHGTDDHKPSTSKS